MSMTLRAARINRGLKQSEVAVKLKVDRKTISSWEQGKTMPRIDKINALCELLDVAYDDIRWKH